MAYKLEYAKKFSKDLYKIDINQAKIILKWLDKNLNNCNNPKEVPSYKDLKGNYKGKFRYKIGHYRVICEVNNNELIIIALTAGHRKEIY
jgi:mRNA interferase RelE/StbE